MKNMLLTDLSKAIYTIFRNTRVYPKVARLSQ